MKKLICILVFLWVPLTAVADGGFVIKVAEALQNGNIRVNPGTEYSVDLSGYKIPADAELIILHVLDSPVSHYYYQKIQKQKTVYTLSANALKASTGSPSFRGLKLDDSAFLIIGSEVQPGSINMGVIHEYDSIAIRVQTQ